MIERDDGRRRSPTRRRWPTGATPAATSTDTLGRLHGRSLGIPFGRPSGATSAPCPAASRRPARPRGAAARPGIDTRQRGQDPGRRVRDQRRVMVRHQIAVALDEIEQVGHLLEIRRHIRVVTDEMRVVELNVDHVLVVALQLATVGRLRSRGRRDGSGYRRPDGSSNRCSHNEKDSLHRRLPSDRHSDRRIRSSAKPVGNLPVVIRCHTCARSGSGATRCCQPERRPIAPSARPRPG